MNSVTKKFQDSMQKTLEHPMDAALGSTVVDHGLFIRLEHVLYDHVALTLEDAIDAALLRRSA